ncbi:hypothetical protein GGX14DRAFT_553416 [Mycena pura]|uniref:Ubiquitin-like protease family profile domain-containing protein n=1 Tax=Mycena pura TaxID=153505 RepID=A0AAD7E604_9AGAR|nr:hypothetical protein GGX14DRAFT_553416 [Mycena pura]
MNYELILDDDELSHPTDVRFIASEWRGCGRVYSDLPTHVSRELERARSIPPDLRQTTLPSDVLSPADVVANGKLPTLSQRHNDGADNPLELTFDNSEPNFIPTTALDVALPPFKTMQRLDKDYGQAWLDNKQSIRDDRVQPTRYLPLWYTEYFFLVRRLVVASAKWEDAVYYTYGEVEQAELNEPEWREKTMDALVSISGWHGHVPGPESDFMFDHLADILGENWLTESIVNGLVADVRRRMNLLMPESKLFCIADLEFTQYIEDYAANTLERRAKADLGRYEDLLRSSDAPRFLAFPLYSPQYHWTAGVVVLEQKTVRFGDPIRRSPPPNFVCALTKWLCAVMSWSSVSIKSDLPCGRQRDRFNCGIIAANTIANFVLGEELWHERNARALRFRAFCTLAHRILQVQNGPQYTGPLLDPDATEPHLPTLTAAPAPSTDIETMATSSQDALQVSAPLKLGDDDVNALLSDPASAGSVASKRARPTDLEAGDEEPAQKRAKGSSGKIQRTAKSSKGPLKLTASSLRPRIPDDVQLRIVDSLRTGGQSMSARHDRVLTILINAGLYRGSESKKAVLRRACVAAGDPNPGLDIHNPKQVVCSRCKEPVALQSAYQPGRFEAHLRKTKPCKPAPQASKTISNFFGVASKTRTLVPSQPREYTKYCGGLTGRMHPRIDYYIEHCPATGGGARNINFYVAQLFEQSQSITSITDPRLTPKQRRAAYHRQTLDREWRIDTSPHSSAVVSTKCIGKFTVYSKAAVLDPTVVCELCAAVFASRGFRTAINRDREKPYEQLKCTPKIHSNPIQARLMGKYAGLEQILDEVSSAGLVPIFGRFVRSVCQGQYNNQQVLLGLVETQQLATERQIRGKGMQNMKYPLHYRGWCALLRLTSPEAARLFAENFRTETVRSMNHQIAQRPRFPVGITARNFEFLAQYCSDYGYPPTHPLCVSVDDTKLFPAMHPLHDASEKTWYLLGLPGDRQLRVASPEELDKLIDQKHKPATKLRLFVIQIPFPHVPPLAFAIVPIASTIKAPELIQYQRQLLDGLIERSYRFISNVADGAAVERDVQARVADASTTTYHKIQPPEQFSATEPISVPLHAYDGNIFINTQDAAHARKTGRNNLFSGARLLVLGDHVVYYHQVYDLAVNTDDSPLYAKDVVGYDKQDDNAANRVFSGAALRKLMENPAENMGLVVYSWVVAELVDAYESCTMTPAERAGAAILARLFFRTWKLFLGKMGYSLARHYISPAADKIFDMLIDGLLGLQIIHRDHLPNSGIPLLPWKHASMGNERVFAALRGIYPDFSLVQAIHALPHLRATMTQAKKALFAKSSFKATRNGYTFSDLEQDTTINYAQLARQPTDGEYTAIFGEQIEANHTLWSLLNVDVWALPDIPAPIFAPNPVAVGECKEHLTEDDLAIASDTVLDLGLGDELDRAFEAVKYVQGLRKEDEDEITQCAYAAAALVVDNLAKLDDLPELVEPAALEQSRNDIALAIKMQPDAILHLLSSMKGAFGAAPSAELDMSSPCPLADLASGELEPLAAIRDRHQTERARKGVKTYRALASNSTTTDKKSAEPTERQLLARRLQAVMRKADKQNTTAGMARKAHTEATDSESIEPAGNAANAAVVAANRANDVLRKRRAAAKGLQSRQAISEAGISHLTPLRAGDWLFAVCCGDIVLAQVITLYSKGGGKGGRHDWIPQILNIAQVSYAAVRVYQYSGARSFRRIHRQTAAVGVSTFAHLPSGAVLVRVADTVVVTERAAEISKKTAAMFVELVGEKEALMRMTTILTTVQRKGRANSNILDIVEDDGVDD